VAGKEIPVEVYLGGDYKVGDIIITLLHFNFATCFLREFRDLQ
jgi:hypothetical protein